MRNTTKTRKRKRTPLDVIFLVLPTKEIEILVKFNENVNFYYNSRRRLLVFYEHCNVLVIEETFTVLWTTNWFCGVEIKHTADLIYICY